MHRCYGRIASGAHDPKPTKAELKSRIAAVSCRTECAILSVGSTGGIGQ